MQIVDLSESGLSQHFARVSRGDAEAFAQDLKELGPSKLKKVCLELGVEMGEEKAITISRIAEKMKEIDAKKGDDVPEAETPPEAGTPSEAETPPKATQSEDPNVLVELKVNPKYKGMVPRPSPEQLAIMTKDIRSRGVQERIKVLPDMTIVDGHTRHDICKELGLPITADMVEVVDVKEENVPDEIFSLNVARRQLSALEKLKWIKKYLPKIKEDLKKETLQKKGLKKKEEEELPGFLQTPTPPAQQKKGRTGTRERVAKATGVGTQDVKYFNWLEKYMSEVLTAGLDDKDPNAIQKAYSEGKVLWDCVKKHTPELFEKVRKQEMKLTDAYKEASKIEKQKKKTEPARVPGPLEKSALAIKETYMKVLEKKYSGTESWTPDEFEAEFINRLDAFIEKYVKKNQ